MQLLAQAPIGQEMLIVGENRCGVRSVEKMLDAYGDIAKIDSARRCGLYHFCLKKHTALCVSRLLENLSASSLR
ncbi:ribosomal RNA small subunit methyltransferase C [Pasteurella multocida]|nr:ribosomal RNA small subunit methyltransferase C [Pasteurella multocida]